MDDIIISSTVGKEGWQIHVMQTHLTWSHPVSMAAQKAVKEMLEDGPAATRFLAGYIFNLKVEDTGHNSGISGFIVTLPSTDPRRAGEIRITQDVWITLMGFIAMAPSEYILYASTSAIASASEQTKVLFHHRQQDSVEVKSLPGREPGDKTDETCYEMHARNNGNKIECFPLVTTSHKKMGNVEKIRRRLTSIATLAEEVMKMKLGNILWWNVRIITYNDDTLSIHPRVDHEAPVLVERIIKKGQLISALAQLTAIQFDDCTGVPDGEVVAPPDYEYATSLQTITEEGPSRNGHMSTCEEAIEECIKNCTTTLANLTAELDEDEAQFLENTISAANLNNRKKVASTKMAKLERDIAKHKAALAVLRS